MSGRKPAVAPTKVIEVVLQFKDRIVRIDENDEKKIVFASNCVWNEISEQLDNRMSGKAIYTFVFEGRYSVKEKLGFSTPKSISEINIPRQVSNEAINDITSSDSSDQSEMPSKKFVFTFSVDEWKTIQPQEMNYKMIDKTRPMQNTRLYYVLPKSNWTPIMAEHFWEHTSLPCCLSFKRAKVTPDGYNYVVVVARCTVCKSHFKGTIAERPSDSSRVLMNCIYTGNYNDEHKISRKRRLLGPTISKYTTSVVKEGISCETTREREAARLMKMGDCEPPIIPSGNSLRALKCRKLASERRHVDTLTSLVLMAKEEEYNNILHDIGCNPFFVHYFCSEQINIYRQYCRSVRYPKLVIDATGSVVKPFKKLNAVKTNSIFLYEAVIYLFQNKQCVITQYSTLQDYVRACASLLHGDVPLKSHWVPRCFVRVDIAHFIKTISKWIPLKSVARRVREVILRAMGFLIQSQSLIEMRSIFLSLFVVFTNETDGTDIHGEDTPCEKHRQNLISATSLGFIDFQTQFDELIAMIECEDDARQIIEDEYERQNEGLELFENPFESWTNEIYNESKMLIKEGTGINPLYLPNLVPHLIKCTKLLPLWSGVMVPIFGYGEEVSSSAAVESSFKKLKTVTLKHVDLPTNLERFLENHIMSLKSSSMLRAAKYHTPVSSPNDEENHEELISHPELEVTAEYYATLSKIPTQSPVSIRCNDDEDHAIYRHHKSSSDEEELVDYNSDDMLYIPKSKCSLCSTGNPPKVGANKCSNCKKLVYTFSTCSVEKPGTQDDRLCMVCSLLEEDNIRTENNAQEKWNRKNKKQRKNNSYLTPNPHLRYLTLTKSNSKRTLPVLKNGSRFEELKGCRTNAFEGRFIFNNTCAFDSLASLIMVSYCDSQKYSEMLDISEKSDFINFICKILNSGITSASYSHRADLIINNLTVEIKEMEYATTLVVCASTIGHVIDSLMEKYPSAKEISNCPVCKNINERKIMHFTFQINDNDNISKLQNFFDERLEKDFLICGHNDCKGLKTVTTDISEMHIFIDILIWEGEEAISSQRSSEAATIFKIKLCDIPELITVKSTVYELRGALAFQRPKSSLRNSVGHYTTYTKRGSKNWELYDDLKKLPVQVKEQTIVPVEFLFYSV
ncbi:unnamed protein product [Macrosiphum euphorbiae]|uniref:NOF-FB transposable element protein n=1 Tax=Macrosiphum euphorbiae TaxID=13131 RepID=A0AAV0Y275_9HEMI|nr:unnamed protein product [Macrosiphum euphorbiae]